MHGLRGADERRCRRPLAVLATLSGLVGALALLALSAAAPGSATSAAEAPVPSPPAAGVTMTAQAMLGANARSWTWLAFRVELHNNGPAVDGELRVSTLAQGTSTYSVPVQLPPGARQEHFLYAPAGALRYVITLTSGPIIHASASVPVALDGRSSGVYVVAERPQPLVGQLGAAAGSAGAPAPVTAITAADLPHRVEAWSAIDLLAWQDVDSGQLQPAQAEALHTWVVLGGDLVILAGSRGAAALTGFATDLLPFRPRDAGLGLTDLEQVLGSLPEGAMPAAALVGTLERGEALAAAGDSLVAARVSVGSGSVTLVGLDPAIGWLADSTAGRQWWAKVVPAGAAAPDVRLPLDDTFLADAVANLPAVQLPRGDHLFLLIVAYVIAIGPANYWFLRRRDRREWAWLTMPLTIAGFAVAAYVFGVVLRGSNVVINQLAVVLTAPGSDVGLADVHIGVFSPSRASFDVVVAGSALLSQPTSSLERGARPLDVVQGDPAIARGYAVGFGALRAFRAQATVPAPRLETDLRLDGATLRGGITNASGSALAHVSVVFAGDAFVVGPLGAGESRELAFTPTGRDLFRDLADRLFPEAMAADADEARLFAGRRAVIRHLGGAGLDFEGRAEDGILRGPVILAWLPERLLSIDIGSTAQQLDDAVFVVPIRLAAAGNVIFGASLIDASVVGIDAVEAFDQGDVFWLSGGTISVDYRPPPFEGAFRAQELALRLSPDRGDEPAAGLTELAPLPTAEQPDPDAPLATDPRADERPAELPRLQLFDLVAGTWVEFEPAQARATYLIADPGRYVDAQARLQVRFVVGRKDAAEFSLGVRIRGTVE